jgi:hypothetical protein
MDRIRLNHQFIGIPLIVVNLENWDFWSEHHLYKNIFHYNPLCTKDQFINLNYRLNLLRNYSPLAAFGVCFVQIACLQSGLFSVPNLHFAIKPLEVKDVESRTQSVTKDNFESNVQFLNLTNALEGCASELISLYISARLTHEPRCIEALYKLVCTFEEKYFLPKDILLEVVSKAMLMYPNDTLDYIKDKLYELYEDNQIIDYISIAITEVKVTSTLSTLDANVSRHRLREQKRAERHIYYKLNHAVKQYDRAVTRWKRNQRRRKDQKQEQDARPRLSNLFLYYDYVKFKYKNEVSVRGRYKT